MKKFVLPGSPNQRSLGTNRWLKVNNECVVLIKMYFYIVETHVKFYTNAQETWTRAKKKITTKKPYDWSIDVRKAREILQNDISITKLINYSGSG